MRRPSEVQLRSLLKTRFAFLTDPIRQDPQNSSGLRRPQTVQDAIVEVAKKLSDAGLLAYMVGGTLRDLLVATEDEKSVRPRDVDIIVEGTTRDQLQDLLGHFLSLKRLTRFGGLHLIRPLASGSQVQFDIWTLADTWGFHSQHIVPCIEDFPGTTFLNIDSCAFEFSSPRGRGYVEFVIPGLNLCFDAGVRYRCHRTHLNSGRRGEGLEYAASWAAV